MTKGIYIRLFVFALLLFVVWQFAIKSTLHLRSELDLLQTQVLLAKETPAKLSMLKQKEQQLNKELDLFQLQGKSIQNNLLATLNTFTINKDLKIKSFSEPHELIVNEKRTIDYQFELEGTFETIQQAVNSLENNSKFGTIVHLNYTKNKNYRTGKNFLVAKIIIKR